MDEILQLNEFFVEGGDQQRSHVLLHITEPSTPEETAKGYFFALCEMNSADKSFIAKLQEIIDTAENEYYETPDEPSKSALEVILEKINQQAFNLIDAQVQLNCVIGVIRQPDIMFAYSGKPHMLLFYKNKQNLFQRLDLITVESGTASETPNQLFSDIIQGKISPADFIFVATPHVADYFNADRLQKIITSRPARQSAEHIERVLGDLREGYSFGGLIIHIHRPSAEEVPLKKQRPLLRKPEVGAVTSLFTTEKQTARTLSPSLIPKMSSAVKSIFKEKYPAQSTMATPKQSTINAEINASHKNAHRPRPSLPPNASAGEKAAVVLKVLLSILSVIGKAIAWIAVALYSFIYTLLRNIVLLGAVITNYQNRRRNILDQWSRQWRSYKENVRQLPLVTKLLFIASLVLLIVFTVSILYVRHHQQNVAREQAFQKSIQDFKVHKDAMESSLIYKDETSALKELDAARALFAAIDCAPKEHKDTCANLQEQLNDAATRIRKITDVDAAVVTKWSSLEKTPQGLTKIGSLLVAYAGTTSTLFTYDIASSTAAVYTTNLTITGFTDAAAPKENDYLALVYDKNKLLSFNPTDHTAKNLDISFPHSSATLTGIAIYNRRLYALDNSNSAIYRHDTIKTGFEQGVVWSQTGNESLSGGSDLTIDGDVFALLNNGHVTKFSKGLLQPFDITGLDPALTNGGRIWTYADSTNLYVLDSVGKRLIILDKEGHLKQQITSSLFTNPSGVAIDEPGKAAYILDSGTLYKVGI